MRKFPSFFRAARFLATAIAIVSFGCGVKANPYASAVTNSGGTVSFILNESATDVKVQFNDGAVTSDLGALPAGAHSFAVGVNTNYGIFVFKTGSGTITQTSIDANNLVNFFAPRGVAVNQNPQRPNFGRIYVENPWVGTAGNGRAVGKGIYVLNADQSDSLGQGNTALVGGMSLGTSERYSPYKISVGIDDTVYVADAGGTYTSTVASGASAGSTGGGIWAVAPDFSSSTDLFNTSDAVWNGGVMFGGAMGTPVVQGSLATSNLVVDAVEWDLHGALYGYETVWQYSNTPPYDALPFVNTTPPTAFAFAGNGSVNGVLADLAVEPLSGNIYTMEERGSPTGAGNITLRVFSPAGGATSLWDSSTANGGNDPMVLSYGIAISPDGQWLANYVGNGTFLLTGITNGIPDPTTTTTNKLVTSPAYSGGVPTAIAARGGVAWDAADNLYVTLTATPGLANDAPTASVPAVLRVYSLGSNTVAITRNDTSSANGSFQFIVLPPPPTITASALNGADLVLTFTSPKTNDTTNSFAVQSSAAVTGTYVDINPVATITQPGGIGTPFQAAMPVTNPVQFYRIRHL